MSVLAVGIANWRCAHVRTICVASLAAACALACGGSGGSDGGGPTQPLPLSRIVVSPGDVTVRSGQTTQLTASGFASDNSAVSVTVSWSSADPTIAKVDATTGVVTGVHVGATQIQASSGTVTTQIKATVTAGVATQLVKVTGDAQSDTVGKPLANPLTVRALDANGNVVQGATVSWNASGGTLSATSAVTDTAGVAHVAWTLGTVPGTQTVTAGFGSGQPLVQFTATAIAHQLIAAQLAKVGGDGQSDTATATLATPLTVRVTDASGTGVPGAIVTWNPSAGSVASTTTTTDQSGSARAIWQLGSHAGSQTLSASIPGLPPVQFSASARAAHAAQIRVTGGATQTDTIGARLPTQLGVQVLDAYGNAVPAAQVTWSTSSGSVSPSSSATDALGQTTTTWTLASVLGSQTATAAVSGLSPVQFSATALPGAPASITVFVLYATTDTSDHSGQTSKAAVDTIRSTDTGYHVVMTRRVWGSACAVGTAFDRRGNAITDSTLYQWSTSVPDTTQYGYGDAGPGVCGISPPTSPSIQPATQPRLVPISAAVLPPTRVQPSYVSLYRRTRTSKMDVGGSGAFGMSISESLTVGSVSVHFDVDFNWP